MVCIRENTEDVYSGMESWPDEDTVHCVKVITRGASERVAVSYNVKVQLVCNQHLQKFKMNPTPRIDPNLNLRAIRSRESCCCPYASGSRGRCAVLAGKDWRFLPRGQADLAILQPRLFQGARGA